MRKPGRPKNVSVGKAPPRPATERAQKSDLKKRARRLAKQERAEFFRVASKMLDFVSHWSDSADRLDAQEFLLRMRLISSDEPVIMLDNPSK
jgi:hypothetical protein